MVSFTDEDTVTEAEASVSSGSVLLTIHGRQEEQAEETNKRCGDINEQDPSIRQQVDRFR